MPRWEGAFSEAIEKQGGRVDEIAGPDDYQGWGAILAQKGDLWGAIGWSYGSCEWCDPYEDGQSSIEEEVANSLMWTTEREARETFAELISRGW